MATQQVNRAHDQERELRQHQQRRAGWLEANAQLGPQYRQVVRALAWQRRATGLAVGAGSAWLCPGGPGPGARVDPGAAGPGVRPPPRSSSTGTAEVSPTPTRPSAPNPRTPVQRADRQRARAAIERVQTKQRPADRTRDTPADQRVHQPATIS